MTLYHFGNCVGLIYVPYYLTYKYAGLAEYGAFWKCVQAALVYVFTQLIKMLILATFFPDNLTETGSEFVGEFMKSSVDIVDLMGIHILLVNIPGKGHSKIITASIGWSIAEVVLSRAALLWVGARGPEFDWCYVQKSLESNILFLHHITAVALVWLWSRHDLKTNFQPIVLLLLMFSIYKTWFYDVVLTNSFSIDSWHMLALKLLVALSTGSLTLVIYAGLAQTIGIF